jgi:hypothetical protein
MAIPETSREAMQEAIAGFDRGERSPRWRETRVGWMGNGAHKYAIAYQGRHYPVKEIIRLAIRAAGGDWMVWFSGGETAANRYARKYGFEIVPLEAATNASR